MSLVSYAESELNRIGMPADSKDEMNLAMRNHILHMIKEFADEGHSGFSASYAVSLLSKLMRFKPLSPLTGEDDEWAAVAEQSGGILWQNKRASHVFKDSDGAYDINGKVFWEWQIDRDGNQYKSYYSGPESKMPVEFPYMLPEEPIYEYRFSDADPLAPPQTEERII